MSQTPAQSPEGEGAAPSRTGPDDELLKSQLETLLFITDRPLSLDDLRRLTKVRDAARLGALVAELRGRLEESGSPLQILEIAGGFQMATRPAHGDLVRKLFAEKMTMRLSTAAHETLAIIAYKQPLTRAEIEEIRGVEVIAALETLLEKRLIKVVGRKESVGRPLLYGTTADFMRHFGLRSLEDMPPIESFSPPEGEPGAEAPVPTERVPQDEARPGEAAPEPPAADSVPEETPAAAGVPAPEPEPAREPLWPGEDESAGEPAAGND